MPSTPPAAPTRTPSRESLPIVIVGAGFSGIATAIYLQRAGIRDFVVLEKGHDVGGTWRENTYPGAACDVPSHLYSFSFEPNPRWTRAFSPQHEILEYLRHCARKYEVTPHIRFGAHVDRAAFDESTNTWTVHLKDGTHLRARAVVLGNGALHLPRLPSIPGRESFEGASFHSAQWDHAYDLANKRVAVIGTGASAIQFVPQIRTRVAKLHLFQRTAPWIVPKPDRAYSETTHALFARVPALHNAYRASIYWRLEAQVLPFLGNETMGRVFEWVAKTHLRKHVADPVLRERLTPKYRMGCKRILLSNDYLPAVAQPNVELVTDAIERITPEGVRTRDGREREVDAIIYGTGFSVTNYLAPLNIVGRDGRDLNAVWQANPEAYLGITIAGFPNLFLLMGPNTGLGHNSMIFMIEAQARYAAQCLAAMRDRALTALDVKPEVQRAFNAELAAKMARTVWTQGGCNSWYLDETGRNTTLWPGATWDYWLKTRRVDLDDFEQSA